MPRSGAAARTRLREAALVLYAEQGYDVTTTAQIAARAGLTERTYFRHFADKREVLFDGEQELFDVMRAAIASAPGGCTPLQLVMTAYRAAVPLFVVGWSTAQRRLQIIETSPALQERAHAKVAALSEVLVRELRDRDVSQPLARLAVRAGAAVFEHASAAWTGRSGADLEALLTQGYDELRALTSGY